jgi:hypothetical protein
MVVVALLLLSVPGSFVYWYMQPDKPIDAVLIDKTVPTKEYREHRSLMWTLDNLKYVNKKTGMPFRYDKDYFGFFPLSGIRYNIRELPERIGHPDLIYIVDTLGIYKNDLNLQTVTGERSDLLYGGTEDQEVETIKRAMTQTNILIAEFDSIATPTRPRTSKELESLLGVEWTGWTGRYFADLRSSNTEVPRWLITGYEQQSGKKWSYTGQGIAFVHEDGTVFIMTHGRDIGNGLNSVYFRGDTVRRFGVQDRVRYYYWFDVVKPKGDVEILADYELDVTAQGKALLKKHGLKSTFPAIIAKDSPYNTYYFAGDYADNKPVPSIYNSTIAKPVYSTLSRDADGNTGYFYWRVYYPLMTGILSELPR